MITTLNKIKAQHPCTEGWKKLLKHLNKTKADDESLSILTVIESNGLDDALWCLRAVEGNDKEIRLYAVWCARQVQHLMTDQRSINCLDVAEKFANGLATYEELRYAWDAAWDATKDAAWAAARAAAWAAESYAWNAARAAASDATKAVACDAARNATRAARAAACDAAQIAQKNKLIEICTEVV